MTSNNNSSSIRRADLLTLCNLRQDGRKPNEIRRMKITLGCVNTLSVTGSACIEMGLTTVIATVSGPIDSTSRRGDETTVQENDRCTIDVSVQVAPFADSADAGGSNSGGSSKRSNSTQDRRLIEISSYIQSSLESCVLVQLYPQSTIVVNVCIVQDDGNRLCTAVNTAMCAIIDAGIPVKDICCACSAGYPILSAPVTTSFEGTNNSNTENNTNKTKTNIQQSVLIDLNRREEIGLSCGPVVVVPCTVIPNRGTVVWTHCETGRIPTIDTMEVLIQAVFDSCRIIYEHIQSSIRERAITVINSRMNNSTIQNVFN
jgi:exosome complex component RRP41